MGVYGELLYSYIFSGAYLNLLAHEEFYYTTKLHPIFVNKAPICLN